MVACLSCCYSLGVGSFFLLHPQPEHEHEQPGVHWQEVLHPHPAHEPQPALAFVERTFGNRCTTISLPYLVHVPEPATMIRERIRFTRFAPMTG